MQRLYSPGGQRFIGDCGCVIDSSATPREALGEKKNPCRRTSGKVSETASEESEQQQSGQEARPHLRVTQERGIAINRDQACHDQHAGLNAFAG